MKETCRSTKNNAKFDFGRSRKKLQGEVVMVRETFKKIWNLEVINRKKFQESTAKLSIREKRNNILTYIRNANLKPKQAEEASEDW